MEISGQKARRLGFFHPLLKCVVNITMLGLILKHIFEIPSEWEKESTAAGILAVSEDLEIGEKNLED